MSEYDILPNISMTHSPDTHLSGSEGFQFARTEAAKNHVESMGFKIYTPEVATKVAALYEQALREGMSGNAGAQLPMIDSKLPYVDPMSLVPGERALVINFGGTNVRASVNEIQADHSSQFAVNGAGNLLYKQEKITRKKFSSAGEFYATLLGSVSDLVQQVDPKTIHGVAIIYSFEGTMFENGPWLDMMPNPDRMTKGFHVPGVGEISVAKAMLETDVLKPFADIQNIKVMNDMPPVCDKAGIILATGLNTGVYDGKHYLVTETAHFHDLPMSVYDSILDERSEKPGRAIMEKQTAGGDAGNLFGIIVEDLQSQGLISNSVSRVWRSEDVTGFVNDHNYLSDEFSPEDQEIMRAVVAEPMTTRSAQVIGIATGTTFAQFPEVFTEREVRVPAEGALIPGTKGYAERASAYAWFASKQKHLVTFVPGQYLDMKGAARMVLAPRK